jgi:hypothetical protein
MWWLAASGDVAQSAGCFPVSAMALSTPIRHPFYRSYQSFQFASCLIAASPPS